MNLPSTAEIEKAKHTVTLPKGVSANYSHNDCVRIAYAWLDAQRKLKSCRVAPSKSKIANWSARYISNADVYLAAHLHPDIIVKEKKLNISRNDTRPLASRLDGIGEAGQHPNYRDGNFSYSFDER